MSAPVPCGFYVCIDDEWVGDDGQESIGPEKGSIQVLTSFRTSPDGSVWFDLAGWPDMWEAECFRLITASEFEALDESLRSTGSDEPEWLDAGFRV